MPKAETEWKAAWGRNRVGRVEVGIPFPAEAGRLRVGCCLRQKPSGMRPEVSIYTAAGPSTDPRVVDIRRRGIRPQAEIEWKHASGRNPVSIFEVRHPAPPVFQMLVSSSGRNRVGSCLRQKSTRQAATLYSSRWMVGSSTWCWIRPQAETEWDCASGRNRVGLCLRQKSTRSTEPPCSTSQAGGR